MVRLVVCTSKRRQVCADPYGTALAHSTAASTPPLSGPYLVPGSVGTPQCQGVSQILQPDVRLSRPKYLLRRLAAIR